MEPLHRGSRSADALKIDVRAVADLDARLDSAVQRVMDRSPDIQKRYKDELAAEPPKTSTVLQPLIPAMNADGIDRVPQGESEVAQHSRRLAQVIRHGSRSSSLSGRAQVFGFTSRAHLKTFSASLTRVWRTRSPPRNSREQSIRSRRGARTSSTRQVRLRTFSALPSRGSLTR